MQQAEAAAGGSAVLSDAVAQRALFSLQEAAEVLIQYIEQQLCEAEEQGERLTSSAVRQALLLAALRAVSRCGLADWADGAAAWLGD